jgi:hypothetical protein
MTMAAVTPAATQNDQAAGQPDAPTSRRARGRALAEHHRGRCVRQERRNESGRERQIRGPYAPCSLGSSAICSRGYR